METAPCSTCKQTLPVESFGRDKSKPRGFSHVCRACVTDYKRRWHEANKERTAPRRAAWAKANRERVSKYQRQYREENRDTLRTKRATYNRANLDKSAKRVHAWRARKFGGGGVLTETEWAALLAAYDGRCAYCGAAEQVGRDHLVPLSRRGANDVENTVPACLSCNGAKNDRTPLEWFLSDTPRARVIMAHLAGRRLSA